MHLWRHSVCGRPHCCRSHKTISDRHSFSSGGKPLGKKGKCMIKLSKHDVYDVYTEHQPRDASLSVGLIETGGLV